MNATLNQPAPKVRSNEKPELREQLLRELRGGSVGVQRWNGRPLDERKELETLPRVDLSGAVLAGVNLGSLALPGACFDGATMTGAWLLESNLAGATFQGANLEGVWCVAANLQGADFTKASLARGNLRECDCGEATFREANLAGATLNGANLCGADLSWATLRGAAFEGASYDERTRWPHGIESPSGLRWAGVGEPPLDLDLFVKRLHLYVDVGRLGRALAMLKAESFQLFSQVESDTLTGVVKSQTEEGKVYSCRLVADGSFACCTKDLDLCKGLRGALCKHLLLLIVGLTRVGKLEPAAVERWVKASRQRMPVLDPDAMSEPLLRYQAAKTGVIDWRPTETIPEDYYTL